MLVRNLMDAGLLSRHIENGVVSKRRHPTLPISVLNYTPKASFGGIWDEVTVQCRGLIVDDEGCVVSRCMPKFWNLSQEGYVLGLKQNVVVDADLLLMYAKEWGSELSILRKMDGMMGQLWEYGGQWGISTRGSFESEGATFATKKFQKFVKCGATEFIPKGWSLIWEIIDKKLRIVIPYQWSGLCLLKAVNNETGEDMPYEQLHELWVNLNSYSKILDANGVLQPGKPWCRIVDKFDIDIATAQSDDSKEEGYVISVNRKGGPSLHAKVKLDEYCKLHKRLTGTTPQMIWNEMAHPVDTFLTTESRFNRVTKEVSNGIPTSPEFSSWVKQWQRGLTKAFHENLLKALSAVELLRRGEENLTDHGGFKHDAARKDWLLHLVADYNEDIVNVAMLLYRENLVGAYEALWEMVRPFGRDERFFVEGKGE